MRKRILFIVLFAWSGILHAFSQQQANYELANEFQAFGLGGNFTANSLNLWPNEINGTDKFWFEFHTTVGKDYYFVDPERRLKEPLFDKGKMASGIAQITRGVVDRNKLELSDIKFSENLASFSFSYKGRNYEYNRLTHQIVEKKKEKSRSLFDRYSWMKYSPDRKYLVYVKKHNLYVKGNGEMGMDTTEVQLTTDGVRYYSYAHDGGTDEEGEVMSDICWCPDSRHLYLVREDERLLRDFWVINSLDDRPSLTTYRYEFPGDKNVTQNELVIVDVIGRTVKKTDISKWPDQYINPLCVTKDSKYLFFERTKRTWDEVDLCSVNLSTMEVKEIIHEVDKPYRDPHARSVAILNDEIGRAHV